MSKSNELLAAGAQTQTLLQSFSGIGLPQIPSLCDPNLSTLGFKHLNQGLSEPCYTGPVRMMSRGCSEEPARP